jgi:3-oxoadipate enol-lactonase
MTTIFAERIAIEIDGDGDPVLLVHGLGGTTNTWTALGAAFARMKRIRFDLPGSGRSDRVEGPLSIARFVQAALRALAVAGVERAHVVGHSMGTIVAAHLAAEHPKLVRSLALFGPLLAPPDTVRPNLRARGVKARAEGMQDIADALVQASTSSATKTRRPAAVAFVRESLMRQPPDGYARSCDALADAQPADPSRIACRTLLVTGDEDVVAPPTAVRQMGEKIAAGGAPVEVEVLRGCGHWTPIEMPEECTQLLHAHYAKRMA